MTLSGRLYAFVRPALYLSRRTWIIIVLTFFICAGMGGYLIWNERVKARNIITIGQEWHMFDMAAAELDQEKMMEHLNKLAEVQPDDPRIAKRQQSIQLGVSDNDDPVMNTFWINQYLRLNQLEKAAIEAKKRIEVVPTDWQARCVLAHQALLNKKRDEAVVHLTALPSPMSFREPVGPGPLTYGLMLHRAAQVNDDSLRLYRATQLVPVFKLKNLHLVKPVEKLQLLQLYESSLEDLDRFPELATYWIPSMRLTELLIEEPGADLETLKSVGALLHRHTGYLEIFKARKNLKNVDFDSLQNDLAKRIEFVWDRVLKMDQNCPLAYIGLAMLANKRKDYAKSIEFLEEGQKRCKNQDELMVAQSRLLRGTDPLLALKLVEKSLDATEQKPVSAWLTLMESSLAVGRFDKALTACREARKQTPDLPIACVWEARICLDLDRPLEAVAALKPVEKMASTNSEVAEIWTKTLVRTADRKAVESHLEKILADAPNSQVIVLPLRAALQGGFPEVVVKVGDKASVKWSTERELFRVLGDSHLKLSEPRDGLEWDVEQARLAVQAYRTVRAKELDNFDLINKIAWLELKALKIPRTALDTLSPLIEKSKTEQLPVPYLDTISQVLMANEKIPEAEKVLIESAKRSSGVRVWITLAELYLLTNRKNEARESLNRTAGLPRTDYEQAEIVALIKRMNSN